MTKMVECPVKGCEIMIPNDRMCCTKHWYEATDEGRVAWIRGRNEKELKNEL